MLKTFPIDFIRQAFEQKLLQEHNKDPELFGGKNQVAITSFYEQLQSQEQVNRFVETFRDLSNQQNRTGIILNGTLVAPENPSITNLYSSTIVPMSWTCSLRCSLANRDQGIITINNLIKQLKGKKVDIAQLNCVNENNEKYTIPFMVGTIGQGDGAPTLKNGDYVGIAESGNDVPNLLIALRDNGVDVEHASLLYCESDNVLKVAKKSKGELLYTDDAVIVEQYYDNEDKLYKVRAYFQSEEFFNNVPLLIFPKTGSVDVSLINSESVTVDCDLELVSCELSAANRVKVTFDFYLKEKISDSVIDDGVYYAECAIYNTIYNFIEDDGTIVDIIFPPEHTSFEKYKLSLSFDAIRCDEPRNLNEKEYCQLTFSGSATLVDNSVKLGNDLLKISIHKNKIIANPNIDLSSCETYYIEPLEMPSGSNANTQLNQLMSNKFVANTHTDSLSLTLQYTFIANDEVLLLKQWFDYARYGTQDTINDDKNKRISPNIVYDTIEYWCSWGKFDKKPILTKIVGDIGIENTESDTLTISISFQVQGENN